MAALEQFEDFVREEIVVERCTHKQISDELQQSFPGEKGFSVRSMERFCSDRGISKTCDFDDQDLDEVVSSAVLQVGPTYGRKMMTGLLSSRGIHISQQRVGESLNRVSPAYQEARRTATAHQINPAPYHADYPGHKLHVDQNEKLVMFGVTYVAAVDGFSGMIVGFLTMPVKNNIEIYSNLFRPIVTQYGLWDQIRVDQGREWVLMLYVQETLAHFRNNTSRAPHLQSTSKQNYIVERIWVEINRRVNYPIKSCLITLQQAGDIDMDCPYIQYCVSCFTIRVASVGATIAVNSWNDHPIPGTRRGVPCHTMLNNNQATQIDLRLLPDAESATQGFESNGGQLTLFNAFGEDPLQANPTLVAQRETEFFNIYPNFQEFFHTVVNGDYFLFREGILCFIDITRCLSAN